MQFQYQAADGHRLVDRNQDGSCTVHIRLVYDGRCRIPTVDTLRIENQQGNLVDNPSAYDVQFKFRDGHGVSHQFYIGRVLSSSNEIRSPNIDGMSYEEITELQERIGKVERGLSKEIISSQLKTRLHLGATTFYHENKDIIGTLDCQHEYHADCITQWLVQKNVCPLCKKQGLKPMEEENMKKGVAPPPPREP
ncbi:hypothetical protein MKW94_001654 [Papaver nudicaule]|uniref:RING-type E3 ubiquitin transferase n=1 Tax=Papaver nudicaule TaxID=74823 RepID=A0AA41S8S6_PAPNU|nr:hypothetical protein [Papaver nudicaule]